MKYDIFISYRREGGFEAAKMIQEKLKSLGYRVFLDFEDLRTGKFNEKLYSVIEQCADFVVIMSPGCLERCKNDDDWLRLEIVHALQKNRNIIPIMLRNFAWPQEMPHGMEELKYLNGISASDEFFDAYIKKLVSFLRSKPNILRKFKWLWLMVALTITAITSSILFYGKYEKTQRLEQVSNVVIADIGIKMVRLNVEINGVKDVAKRWGSFYQDMAMNYDETYKNQKRADFLAYIEFREKQLENVDYKSVLTDNYTGVLSASKIPMEDIQAFYSSAYKQFFTEVQAFYRSVNSYVKMPVEGWVPQLNEMIALREKMVYLNGEMLYYNILELLGDMPETSYQVYNKISPQLTNFPSVGQLLKNEARSAAEKSFTLYQQAFNEYSALTGQADMDVKQFEKDVERLALKQQKVDILKEELGTMDSHLKQAQTNLIKKCQPLPEDDEWMIWEKMLRLLSAKLNDEALKILTVFEDRMKQKGEPVTGYTKPTRIFIKEYLWKTYKGGVVVIGFQDNRSHSCLKVGDIITLVDGNPFLNNKEFIALRKEKGKASPITILRLASNNHFDKFDVKTQESDPLIGMLDLMEEK
jgi:hypothetical protein